MSKANISVYFVTLNEASTIAQAIEAVAADADEVIVVDSGSDDGTVEIAEKLGAKVIHQPWLGFAKQKAFALEQCCNEWCFNLDGDEVVSRDAMEEIFSLIEADACDLIRVPFEDIFMGDAMHPRSAKRSIVRVFKKSYVRYPSDRSVHENVVGEGRIVKLNHCVTHYGYYDAATLMDKQNTYSSLGAKDKFHRGKYSSLLKLLLVFPVMFLRAYIFRKFFLSGVRGLVHSYIEAMYFFLKEAKLYEQQYMAKQDKGGESKLRSSER